MKISPPDGHGAEEIGLFSRRSAPTNLFRSPTFSLRGNCNGRPNVTVLPPSTNAESHNSDCNSTKEANGRDFFFKKLQDGPTHVSAGGGEKCKGPNFEYTK